MYGATDHPEVAAAIKEAAAAAGSTSPDEYAIKFNVDILAPIVKHADTEVGWPVCACTGAVALRVPCRQWIFVMEFEKMEHSEQKSFLNMYMIRLCSKRAPKWTLK